MIATAVIDVTVVIVVIVVIDVIVARTAAATTVAMIRAGAAQDGGFMPALSSDAGRLVNFRSARVVVPFEWSS